MKRIAVCFAGAAMVLSGCSATSPLPNPTVSPAAFCVDLAAVQKDPVLMVEVNQLLASNPHSAFSVLYSDVAAACQGGVPAAGVSSTWLQMVIGLLEAALPYAMPALIGVL